MSQVIKQAVDDKITYQFTISGLNGNTLTNADVTSSTLALTNISNDDTTVTVTVNSTGVNGNQKMNMVLTLSNGDVENKCVNFVIGTICI